MYTDIQMSTTETKQVIFDPQSHSPSNMAAGHSNGFPNSHSYLGVLDFSRSGGCSTSIEPLENPSLALYVRFARAF